MLRKSGERIWIAAASGIPRDAVFSAFDIQRWAFGVHKTAAWNAARTSRRSSLPALREMNHGLEGECPHEPPSALCAEGKRCRDPRTARLLPITWTFCRAKAVLKPVGRFRRNRRGRLGEPSLPIT